MEFHISRAARNRYQVPEILFDYVGNVVFGNVLAARKLASSMTEVRQAVDPKADIVNAGALFAMGLLDELSHAMIAKYRKTIDPEVLPAALQWFVATASKADVDGLMKTFIEQFPNVSIYRGEETIAQWLAREVDGMPNRDAAVEELLLLWLANINPAYKPFRELFDDRKLVEGTIYKKVTATLGDYFATRPPFEGAGTLLDVLQAPMLASPDSLSGQLDFIRENWVEFIGEELRSVLLAIDTIREEDIAIWMRFHPADGIAHADWQQNGPVDYGMQGFQGDEYLGFGELQAAEEARRRSMSDEEAAVSEYENFSPDQAWMPTVVLIAKSTYVWLEQLSKKYQRHIHRLDQIPQEELHVLAGRGLNGLWLIGLWERSVASQTIKRMRGQADAVASAYSLRDYRIAEDLGGQPAYEVLRDRAARAGIRLASDMVPNHMGIDSTWVLEHPDWFVSRPESPFPVYRFEGPDLSIDPHVEIKIEDHYFDQTDAAVVFRLRNRSTNHTDFVFHGNDGTTFAWNDTAQLDYSKAHVREQVIRTILEVAKLFPIIRFDAAMVLAKKHVQRLWFPLPGEGRSIPSRSENAMSQEEFDALMPNEFWREVVDRVAVEVPGTLLLAEAFWLLEGYFVRTLGMHRVYNSAFMNMLRDEENAKYRSYLKKTIEFDPDIMKRYVNFMSNPDERTAIDQFGDGDKFFGTCTLLATLPGLPMFGHGQVEGFTERYGMEFKQAKMDETPDQRLVARHQREIAPLLKRRWLFAESTNFVLYDFWNEHGSVDENVFAYSNRNGGERAIVLYNNIYQNTRGTIHISAASMDKGSGNLHQRSLVEGLALPTDPAITIAFHDPVRNLDFLRRASDLNERGLTFELQGYGHVVLQNWRELRSTAEYPWDRLCDALNGSGVHNLEEAVSRLRLRPLHQSLRNALNLENLHNFAAIAYELTQSSAPPPSAASEKITSETVAALGAALGGDLTKPSDVPAPTAATEANPLGEPLLPRLRPFFEQRAHFFSCISELTGHDAPAGDPVGFAEALRLPSLKLIESKTWPSAAAKLLPLTTTAKSEQTWAPVLAYLILNDLSPKPDTSEVTDTTRTAAYDEFHLRAALAETLASLGLEGDQPWRIAARIRLLLSAPSIGSKALWSDPEVRWLAGVNESNGVTYVNREQFEELVSWLHLPALLAAAVSEQDPSRTARLAKLNATLAETLQSIARTGYNLDDFLSILNPPTEPTPTALKTTKLSPEAQSIHELEPSEEPLEAPLPFQV